MRFHPGGWLGGVLLFCLAWTAYGGRFEILPSLYAGFQTEGVAVSADGSVVVGSSGTPSGQRAFRWTEATGTVALPVLAGVTMTWATDVSSDGAWIAGYGGSSFGTRNGWKAFRYHIDGSMDVIEAAGGGIWGKGISGDGQRLAGTSQGAGATDPAVAFTWTVSDGVVPLSGPLYPAPAPTNANAISADGAVIVGDTNNGVSGNGFRWTQQTGMVAVGNFSATATSRDGSVVVGAITTDEGFQAYRWTEIDGIVELPHPGFGPGYTASALGVSGDGSRVVGYIENQSTDLRQAFIWDDIHGNILLKELLENAYGYDLTGWNLTKAYAISDDGNTVVGRGYSPQGADVGFRVFLTPEPSTVTLMLFMGAAGLLRRRGRTQERGNSC
jgi:probable HAF family extracellular repeat protein